MEPEKAIIHNYTSRPLAEALSRVQQAMEKGLISGSEEKQQHCYVTVFADNVTVQCKRNESGSETFTVREEA